LSQEVKGEPTPAKTAESAIEIFTPVGMQLFIGLYWIAGLSGIVLGTLVINQGFFERFFDMQFLLIVQGSALTGLGAAMFVVATGMVSGTRWSLNAGKRVAGISVLWSAFGVSLAVYSTYNLPGLASSSILYGIIIWLLGFGVTVGFIGLRYLSLEGASIRKYAEYVSTEVLTSENRRMLPRAIPEDTRMRRALPFAHPRRFCSGCGLSLREGDTVCPRCGRERDVGYDVT